MAVPDSIDFIVTRDDLIQEALELLGVLGEGESPSANQLTSSARTLNMLVKAWQAEGLNLFALKRIYLHLKKTQREYGLSGATSDHFSREHYATTVDGAVTSGNNTIDVDDVTNISDADYIGIEQASNTMQWTTVNGAPVGSTVTLTDNLTADVADEAIVYSYTTKANRPMKLINIVRRDSSDTDTEISPPINRQEYVDLSLKTTSGKVNQVWYDPQITTGKLWAWPTTDDETDYLVLWVQRTLSDMDSATDNPDYPQEWYLALSYNLALLLIPKYGTSDTRAGRIEKFAGYYKKLSESFDIEESIYIQPTQSWRIR